MSLNKLKFMCGIKKDNYIFASSLFFNGLFKIDCMNGSTEYLGKFPNELLDQAYMHRNAFLIKDCIFFVPYKAKNIHVYNIVKRKFEEIKMNCNGYRNGYIGEVIDNEIYLIPEMAGDGIWKLDPETKELSNIVTKEILSELVQKEEGFIFLRICEMNHNLLLPVKGTNRVLELVASTGKIISHELPIPNIWGGFNGKFGIWLLADGGNIIYYWDNKKNTVEEILYDSQKGMLSKDKLNWIVETSNQVYAFPVRGENLLILKGNKFETFEKVELCSARLQMFYNPIKENECIYLLPMGGKELLKICDFEVDHINIQGLNSNSKLYRSVLQAYMENSRIENLFENEKVDLKQYIDGVINS